MKKVRSRPIPDANYEAAGFVFVAEIDCAGSWEFDTLRVLQDTETGLLLWGHDAGCSCPVPFEEFTSTDHYRVIDPKDSDWKAALSHQEENTHHDDVIRFVEKLKKANPKQMRGKK